MELHFEAVYARLDFLLAGAAITLGVSLATLVISFVLGTGLALCRIAPQPILRAASALYLDLFRNTPFLVQLFFFYFGLPEIGLDADPILTGIVALSLATATHNAEVLRAGIAAVDRGLVEAAHALGMSAYRTFVSVVFPIALRYALRPLGSVFISMVLTTSVLSTITVNDLMGNAMTVSAETFRPFEVYLVLLLLYCVLTLSLSGGLNLLYRILDRPAERTAVR